MKILLTSRSGQLGGLELRLADEVRFLNRLGNDVTLAVNQFDGLDLWFTTLKNENLNTKVWNVPPFLEKWRFRKLNHIIAKTIHLPWLSQVKPNLIHVAFAWTETGRSHLWLAHKKNIPAIVSVHNAFSPWSPPTKWHERLTRDAFSTVKGIYGVSQSALDNFISIYERFIPNGTKVEVIHNFVDTNRFHPSNERRINARRLLNISDNSLVLGSIGRLDSQKNPHYILDCFLEVRKEFPNCYLVFIGQGRLESEIKKRIEAEGINTFVRFTGFQKNIEEIIPALDLHMLLSIREGFGIATVEAMSCGIPVVGTNVPGTKDILQQSKAGILVPVGDSQLASKSIISLLSSTDKLKTMSLTARVEATEKFSKELWEVRLTKFYNGVIESI